MAPARPVLVVENVEKSFGSIWALQGVSFEVAAGEILGLLGPNGAGKTTLIRMLLDLTRPDAGRVTVSGEEPSTRTRQRIGYLPEERGLYPKQRVIDVLAYLVSLAGPEPNEARLRAEAWLDRVGLAAWRRRRVRELSKGMQQKIQLGAATLHRPALVILDEPFSGLDPINRRLVSDVVRELRDAGAAVIISTHMMDEVEELCDKVVLLQGGVLLLSGPIQEVRARFASASVSVGAAPGWEMHPRLAPLVLDTKKRGALLEVALQQGVDGGQLLKALLEEGFNVDHFSRNLPSLAEVFVMAVAAEPPGGHPPSPGHGASVPTPGKRPA